MDTHVSAQELRQLALRSSALPLGQDKPEIRILSAIVTCGLIYFLLLKPVYYMWAVKGSAIWKAATAATLPNWCIALIFVVCALATMPHLFTLIAKPEWLHCKLPRKLAGAAAGGGGVLWLYLAVNVLATRSPSLVGLYLGNAAACIVVGWAYGVSVNAQQLRERI